MKIILADFPDFLANSPLRQHKERVISNLEPLFGNYLTWNWKYVTNCLTADLLILFKDKVIAECISDEMFKYHEKIRKRWSTTQKKEYNWTMSEPTIISMESIRRSISIGYMSGAIPMILTRAEYRKLIEKYEKEIKACRYVSIIITPYTNLDALDYYINEIKLPETVVTISTNSSFGYSDHFLEKLSNIVKYHPEIYTMSAIELCKYIPINVRRQN